MNAHQQERVKAGANKKEGKVFNPFRPEAGTHGSRQVVEGRKFGDCAGATEEKSCAVAHRREQIAPHDDGSLVEERRNSHRLPRGTAGSTSSSSPVV